MARSEKRRMAWVVESPRERQAESLSYTGAYSSAIGATMNQECPRATARRLLLQVTVRQSFIGQTPVPRQNR